jgi:adenylate cyclase
MAKEIERQYIIDTEHPEWEAMKATLPRKHYIQSTIHRGEGNKLRVRLIEDMQTGERSAAFTFKVNKSSKKDGPNIRDEYEWEVPYRVALFIMIGHGEVIKTRYEYIHTDGKKWELDEYEGTNSGIVLADIELSREDEKFELPDWIGQESTKEKRITNNSFTLHPYANWSEKEKSWYASLRKRK